MSVLPILTWPDARLSDVCAPVEGNDVSTLASDMLDTMYAAKGRGLAAPQVGVMLRLFVMDVTWKDAEPTPMVMINPEVSPFGDDVSMNEVCLSVPDVEVPVARAGSVRVSWTSLDGSRQETAYDGAFARVIQHEFDHLNGQLHFDNVSAELRNTLEAPYLKAQA